jgi:uncharacterized protein
MKGLISYKSISAEVKDVDSTSRKVTGYFSNFGNVDHDKDVISKGAFAKSIQERGPQGANKILFLGFHDWQKVLGKPDVLVEDEKGLYFESTVADTSYGKDIIKLYESGLINEHSIGFNTIKARDLDNGVREIQEVYLWEGSAVVLGANSDTPFTGFKSITKEESDRQIKAITSLLRNGNVTDDTFVQLQIALKQLELQAYEMGKKDALTTQQPEVSTVVENEPQTSENEAILNLLKNAFQS